MLRQVDILTGLERRFKAGVPTDAELTFKNVVVDSRVVRPGDIFFALRGERDGHEFVADAFRNGAAAVVVEREIGISESQQGVSFIVDDTLTALHDLAEHWRKKHFVKVIGITGSVGKTTTKELATEVLGTKFKVLKSEKNLNNEIGLPLTLLRLDNTHDRVVLEMGMYDIGEIDLLCKIASPSVGIVTNIGHSHYERLGSLERIAQAKGELITSLPESGTAILNGEDELVLSLRELTKAEVITYGLQPHCDVWADQIDSQGLDGIRFWLHHGRDSLQVRLPLLGSHSVHSALAVAALGISEGLSWEEILGGLRNISAQLRLVVTPGTNDSTIIDDSYNASPASNLAALNLLAEMEGRKIAVLGDMLELGAYEEIGHRKVGIRVAEVAQKLIAVGPLGRMIGEEAINRGMRDVHIVANNQEAFDILISSLDPGDFVLVKGSRGMKMEEIVERIKAE